MNTKIKEVWSREHTLLLIAEYRKYDILYKVTHPDYIKTNKKSEAIAKIVAELQKVKRNVSGADIRRKMKILNQQMSQEKKRMAACNRSGMSAEKYVPTLWCFSELDFLLNANDEVPSTSNIGSSDDSLSEADNSSGQQQRTTALSLQKFKSDVATELHKTAKKSLDMLSKLVHDTNKPQAGKEETFCAMLCSELKHLKLEETYDNVTAELFSVVRKAKAEERRIMQRALYVPGSTSNSSLE